MQKGFEMSIVTWKSEFHQIDATAVPAKEATEHSLKKWRGLTPQNLEKHGLESTPIGNLMDVEASMVVFSVNARTCALCQIFFDDTKNIGDTCDSCPLFEQLGHSCDFNGSAPYSKWQKDKDPFPMIEALEKILAEDEDAGV